MGYSNGPIEVAAETDVKVKRGSFETSAILFMQHNAPKELLIETDLQEALGIELLLKESPKLSPAAVGADTCKCEKVMVKLLHTSKVPTRYEGWVSVVSSTCNEFQGDAIFEPLSEWEAKLGVEWVSGVTSLKAGKPVVVQVRNVGTAPLTLSAGTEVSHLEPLENYNLTELHADSTVSLGESLPLGCEECEDMKGETVELCCRSRSRFGV